jgi:hypothetical protein
VEVEEPVVWTRPDGLSLPSAEVLPALGIPTDDEWFAALFADQHIERIRRNLPKSEIRALLTLDGSEPTAPRQ